MPKDHRAHDGRSLNEPTVVRFDARCSLEAVSYENGNPDCARYSVRIDLRLKKVIAVRDRKDGRKLPQSRTPDRNDPRGRLPEAR